MAYEWEAMDPGLRAFILEAGGFWDGLRRERSDPYAYLAELWFPYNVHDPETRAFCVKVVHAMYACRDLDAWKQYAQGPPYRWVRGRGKDRIWLIEGTA